MLNPLSSNGSLEMRDEAGRTVHYAVISAEQLQALQAECERLRQQLAAQEQQIGELTRANERLQKEQERLVIERNGIWGLYTEQVRERYRRHPEELEKLEAEMSAALAEAEKNPGDLEGLIRELERASEVRDVG